MLVGFILGGGIYMNDANKHFIFRRTRNLFRSHPVDPSGSPYERSIVGKIWRGILLATGGFVALVAATIAAFSINHYFSQTLPQEKVIIVLEKTQDKCPPIAPINISIYNGSGRTIISMEILLSAFISGHSTDYGDWNGIKSDKIIEPNQKYNFCVHEPISEYRAKNVNADALEWSVRKLSVRFKD